MKKKILVGLLSLVVVNFLLLASALAQVKYMAIATGGTGGGYYPLGGSIGEVISTKIKGIKATAQVTAASIENVKLLNQDKCQMGLINGAIAYGYVEKKLQPIKFEGISSIMSAGYADVVTVVLKSSAIQKMADLKGKRVGIGAPGSATETVNKLALTGWNLFDLKTQKIEVTPEYLSYAETTTALKDRRVQAGMYFITGRPGPAITDLTVTHDVRILSYEPDVVAQLEKAFPFMSRTVYQKGLYKGVDYDSLVVRVPDVFCCRTDLPVDLVYEITKAVHQALPELQKTAYHGFKYFELSRSVAGVFPMHPGAIKYYDELKIK